MAGERLAGRSVLVVGASSGIGRATALAAAAEGARVALAARRVERCEEAAAEAGGESFALACDVSDESSCERAVAETVDRLGGLDAFVFAPGGTVFKPIEKIRAEEWRQTLDVNLIGATSLCSAAIGHLESTEPTGKAVFLSSISATDSPPRHGASPYVVSKVALEALVAAWRGEHPLVRFSTIEIGDTVTEFGSNNDLSYMGEILPRWVEGRYNFGRLMDAESVAEQVVNVLASRESVPRLRIEPLRNPANPFGIGH